MEDAGFHWYYSLLASLTIYTGAFQFVLITFLSSGASLITVAVTAFLMNSRQAFYSLSFVSEFQKMGRKKWYMVHTMTDETYAVNCTLKKGEQDSRDIMVPGSTVKPLLLDDWGGAWRNYRAVDTF